MHSDPPILRLTHQAAERVFFDIGREQIVQAALVETTFDHTTGGVGRLRRRLNIGRGMGQGGFERHVGMHPAPGHLLDEQGGDLARIHSLGQVETHQRVAV